MINLEIFKAANAEEQMLQQESEFPVPHFVPKLKLEQTFEQSVGEIPTLPWDHQKSLFVRMNFELYRENPDKAKIIKEQLFWTNAKLVSLSFQRSNWGKFKTIDRQEFLDEGYTVLQESLEKFNPSLNYRFVTYAMAGITRCFTRVRTRSNFDVRRIPYHKTISEGDTEDPENCNLLTSVKVDPDFYGSKLTIEGIDENTTRLVAERMLAIVKYEEYEFIVSLLNDSPPKVREIVCRIMTGESCQSIGEALGINRRAVWQHKAKFISIARYCFEIFYERRSYEEILSEIRNNTASKKGGFRIDRNGLGILNNMHRQTK